MKKLEGSKFVTGKIIGTVCDADQSHFPIVIYEDSGSKIEFKSKYSVGSGVIGSEVKVLLPKNQKGQEIYSISNRWLFTVSPILMAILIALLSVGNT